MSLCVCVHGMPHMQVNIVMTAVQGLNLLLVIAATSKYISTYIHRCMYVQMYILYIHMYISWQLH